MTAVQRVSVGSDGSHAGPDASRGVGAARTGVGFTRTRGWAARTRGGSSLLGGADVDALELLFEVGESLGLLAEALGQLFDLLLESLAQPTLLGLLDQ